MKLVIVGAVFAAALIGVVLYEEGRISKLESQLAALTKEPAMGPGKTGSRSPGSAPAAAGGSSGKSSRVKVAGNAGDPATPGEAPKEGEWAETFRKMIENPVGAAMIKEEQKGKALRIYGNFIDSLNLNKEEKEYFLGLVAAGVGEEDTVGMKLLAAKTDEERIQILDQMEADQRARKESIEDFLNSEDDYARYEHFEDRKDIYEQMPGLHAAMKEVGAPIEPAQEEKLVEAIFQASVASGMNEMWKGRAGMEQFAEPGATQRFKDQWGQMQTLLKEDVGTILENTAQQTAFAEHQAQVGNMITFGLQFVEGMIAGQQGQGQGGTE